MQRAPKRRFRGPRKPKVLRRHLKAVEICRHPSHPSLEWIEIILWSHEIYQGTIGAVLIYKMFYSSGHKSEIRTLDVSHSSQLACVQTSPISFHPRKRDVPFPRVEGNRRRLHAGYSQPTSETTRKVFIYTSYQNNVTMDDPVSS